VPPRAPGSGPALAGSRVVGRLFVFAPFGATLTLLPPGTRNANRFWMIRDTLSDGRRVEGSTKAAKTIHAVRIAYELAAWRSRTEARSTRRARRGGME
jgi:hypothetical protein